MDAPAPRGLTFGSVAERYERYRPEYPDEVVDLLLADRPASVLEVGAGTGKATWVVAARGVAVTAVEPDPAMAAVLRRTTGGLPVTVVESTFEELGPREPVDLLCSAAAWHWTDPATRWERAAALLEPGGTFACVGGPTSVVNPALDAEVEDLIRTTIGERSAVSLQDGYDATGVRWPGNELEATPWFTHLRQLELAPVRTIAADDLVGHFATVSAFFVQPPDEREDLLARIRAVLPEQVDVRRDLTVHLARRVHQR